MADLILKKVNESMFKIECESDISSEIYNDTRFYAMAAGYLFNPRYKMHVWDGKTRVYSPGTHNMPIGMLAETIRFCKANGYSYYLQDFDVFDDTVNEWFDEELKKNMEYAPYPCRDYQIDAVKKALIAKKGILLSCTSSGKSLMIFNIIKCLMNKKKLDRTMLIVPNVTLVEQMFSDFKSYGWQNIDDDVQLLYGEITTKGKNLRKKGVSNEIVDFTKPVLITTWQSVMKKDREFFQKYNAVLVDECVNGDTLILTPTGEKKIKDIKEGELVISYNEKTKSFEPNKVLEVHQNHNSSKNAKMLRLELEDGKILELTENHPVYTKNRGWVRAGELNEEDDIEVINNNEVSEDTLK